MAPSCFVKGDEVVKKYGDFTAVDHVSFSVKRGECFGFLGPNGAGKTSIMRMIQCFAPVTEGSITVDGMRVGTHDREIKSVLGVVPQDDNLDHDLTVIQNLVIYAGYFGISKSNALKRSYKLLEFFHLSDRPDIPIRELSGGMRRRLTIARSIINEPSLLILDEPTTGLDPQVRRVIWRKLASLKEDGVTMILTTHYMEEASRLCDRIAIMDNGKILGVGTPDKLVRERLGDTVIEFAPSVDNGETSKLLDALNEKYETAGGAFFIFSKEPDDVFKKLADIKHTTLEKRSATLEDLFLNMTGHHLREGA